MEHANKIKQAIQAIIMFVFDHKVPRFDLAMSQLNLLYSCCADQREFERTNRENLAAVINSLSDVSCINEHLSKLIDNLEVIMIKQRDILNDAVNKPDLVTRLTEFQAQITEAQSSTRSEHFYYDCRLACDYCEFSKISELSDLIAECKIELKQLHEKNVALETSNRRYLAESIQNHGSIIPYRRADY